MLGHNDTGLGTLCYHCGDVHGEGNGCRYGGIEQHVRQARCKRCLYMRCSGQFEKCPALKVKFLAVCAMRCQDVYERVKNKFCRGGGDADYPSLVPFDNRLHHTNTTQQENVENWKKFLLWLMSDDWRNMKFFQAIKAVLDEANIVNV